MSEHKYTVPFMTPVDYFKEILESDYTQINNFKKLHERKWGGNNFDNDLHVYPFITAVPGMLSIGCPNICPFCPTNLTHRGKIYFGDPEIIIPQYANQTIHFMDENFFYNDMDKVLPLLKKHNVTWLAMSDYLSILKVLVRYGEKYLYACGLRVIEVGLENVALCKKVKEPIKTEQVIIYYLNMTCLPGETKETIAMNREWMWPQSLKHPIHHNNGLWYACGQFLYPYEEPTSDGRWMEGPLARTCPTWIPNTLLDQDYGINDLEHANQYNQLCYGFKIYRPRLVGTIGEFIGTDQKRAAWMLTGIRCGAII